MKTAISLPDDLFARSERLARRMRKSRSRLFADAMREYLARHSPDQLTAQLDRICAEVDSAPDPLLRRAARRTLRRSEW